MDVGTNFPLWLRAQHLLNFILIGMLIRSGIEMLSSLTRLWWRNDCAPGTEWLKFTKRELPKEEGVSLAHGREVSTRSSRCRAGKTSAWVVIGTDCR